MATASQPTARLIGSVMISMGATAYNAKELMRPNHVVTQNSATSPAAKIRFFRPYVWTAIRRRPSPAYQGTIRVSAPIETAWAAVGSPERNSSTAVRR